jgi:hypothetical protein
MTGALGPLPRSSAGSTSNTVASLAMISNPIRLPAVLLTVASWAGGPLSASL